MTYTLKIMKHRWKKLKHTQINGKAFHIYDLKELLLFRCLYCPKLSTYSCNPYQILNDIFYRKKNSRICVEPQKTLNSQWNSEQEEQRWKPHTSWFQNML